MELTALKTWVFVLIAFRLFVDGAEEFFILPTAWFYVRSFDETRVFLGVVTSAYSIAAVIAGPILGKIADRFGHAKLIIVCSYFMKFLGNLVYSIPVSAFSPLLGRVVAGVGDASSGVFYGQLALYTPRRNLAKVFLFLDGMYALGAAFGPTISSFLTFKLDIYGWKIDEGNSPGVILAFIWFVSLLVAVWLPVELGDSGSAMIMEREVVSCNDGNDDEYEWRGDHENFYEPGYEDVETKPVEFEASRPAVKPPATWSSVLCLYYLIFLSLYFSATVTFYTPLLALEHFHVQFIHVKMLFLACSMFAFALILSLYIAAEYVKEKKLLLVLMLRQTIPIALLSYCAFRWEDVSVDNSYMMLFYICLGMPYFSFGLGSSLVCRITDPKDAAFYQGLCYSMLHMAYVLSRIVSSFIFSRTALLFYCVGLAVSWLAGAVWFGYEYRRL